jgi:phosphomannomutase
MFKAYDIRTKSSKLNKTIINRLIRAVGRYYVEVLKCTSVVIARDARLAAPSIMQSAVDYFTSIGIDVIVNPSQISTCQFYYSCMRNLDSAGMMITASHNPGEYIGIKLMAPNVQTLATNCGPGGGISSIKNFYLEDTDYKGFNRKAYIHIKRYTDDFINYTIQLAGIKKDELKGAKILCDFLNGAVGAEIGEALQKCGATVTMRNLVPDGFFPNGDPNPSILSSVKPTWDYIKKGDFDFGFCYDGDGDRFDIVTKEGIQIAPAFNVTVLLPKIKEIYSKAKQDGYFNKENSYFNVYSDVKANPLSMQLQSSEDTKVHIIRNGHSFIKEALREHCKDQYLVASEESAHYYLNCPIDLNDSSKGFAATENTLFFTLLTAKQWLQNPSSYSEILKTQSSLYRIREWPCHFLVEERMEEIMEKVEKVFKDKGLTIIKKMEDGNDLDATLMRYNLPEVITSETDMTKPWYQVAQRISRSEEGMTRWEIVSNNKQLAQEANSLVKEITDWYVDNKFAEYTE